MKKFCLALCLCFSINVFAQTPAIVNQAIITTKTSTIIPEDMETRLPQTSMGEGGEQRVMMFAGMGDDIKTTTWFKDDKVKVYTETEMMLNTIIFDKKAKKTITLIEAMGTKRGFYSTEEDEKEAKRKMDSMMGSQPQKNAVKSVDIEYIDSSKKIAGFLSKKALIKTTRENGKTDTVEVWYNTEMRMGEGFTFLSGGMMGMFSGGSALSGLDKLNGFPMRYTTKNRRGIVTTVEVTKIDTKKSVDDKVFDVPKDFELKPMKDMMSGGGGGMRFQMRTH